LGAAAVQGLVARLSDYAFAVVKQVRDTIVKVGGPAVPSLTEVLDDPYWVTRKNAAWCLGEIGAAEAVAPLIQRLEDKQTPVRETAAEALGKIGDRQAVQALLAKLDGQAPTVRAAAAKALRKLGYEPKTTAERIRILIAESNWEGVVDIGADAVEPLIEMLKYIGNRDPVIDALSKIGEVAVPALLGHLLDSESSVRRGVAKVLGRIGDRRAVGPLVGRLGETELSVILAVIEALGKLGDPAAAQPLVAKLQEHYATQIRAAAAEALGAIGDAASLDPLRSRLAAESDETVKKAIEEAIATLTGATKEEEQP